MYSLIQLLIMKFHLWDSIENWLMLISNKGILKFDLCLGLLLWITLNTAQKYSAIKPLILLNTTGMWTVWFVMSGIFMIISFLIVRIQEVIMMLDNSTRDFKSLIERLHTMKAYEDATKDGDRWGWLTNLSPFLLTPLLLTWLILLHR